MKHLFAILFCLTLAAAQNLSAAKADDDFALRNLGYSAVPIIGYDDKSGWLYGLAAFAYNDSDPGVNAGLFAVSNFNDFHSATLNYEQRKGRWLYAFHGLSERAFDNYYGDGDLTSPDNPYRMGMYHFEVKPGILYKLWSHFRVGLFDDYRSRLETTVDRLDKKVPGDPIHLFPDENTNAMGIRAEWDSRDKIINTQKGNYHHLEGMSGPNFSQMTLDLRNFRTVYRRVVLASRLMGGMSFGEPSYLFRFRVGGLDTLRGYKDNRFRGKHYVVFQEELRWFVRNWVSVNASVDFGDATDDTFHQLKGTGIVGLRLGLPPDFGQKLRIDLGYGFDQQTFQIQFGEIF